MRDRCIVPGLEADTVRDTSKSYATPHSAALSFTRTQSWNVSPSLILTDDAFSSIVASVTTHSMNHITKTGSHTVIVSDENLRSGRSVY